MRLVCESLTRIPLILSVPEVLGAPRLAGDINGVPGGLTPGARIGRGNCVCEELLGELWDFLFPAA